MTTRLKPVLNFEGARVFHRLSPVQKREFVTKLTEDEALELKYLWEAWARDKQLVQVEAPGNWWTHWVHLAGRGNGKTRTGAEWIRQQAESNKVGRMILVARTAADVRDTMVEGESGLMEISPPWFYPKYEPSKRRITWPNGCMAITFSAEEPDSLRGPQCEKAWADERASWQYDEAWDNLMMGMRLGSRPQCIVTTTPKATKAIKELKKAPTSKITIGSTYENKDNLAPAFLAEVIKRYEGTRLGRQELLAEILEDVEGALWKRESMIEAYRVTKHPPLVRVGVAIDPATTSEEGSAETGIIAGGIAENGHGYILADKSLKASPEEWARTAVRCFHRHQADRIIGETNQGGDMVETIVRMIDPNVSYQGVRATRGKFTRAEPISSLYERGLVHHVGTFPDLEDQLCSWTQGEKSPDRLDALVWLLTYLMLDSAVPLSGYILQSERSIVTTENSASLVDLDREIEQQKALIARLKGAHA